METKLVKLKSDFNNIITIRNTVKNVFDILQIRIDKLKSFYVEFIKNNKNNLFIFGLDSLQFQSKLIDIEYDDMKRLFLAINNRMYCEYFKLHKIIVDYVTNNNEEKVYIDISKVNNYPTYKDLEPFKEYSFELITDIHENILNILSILISTLNNKENELSIHKIKQNIGLNIDNFISTYNFNINVLKEKINMFISYIEFFHKMHSKYLKRFSNKIQLMYTHINNDIKFDDSVEISNTKKKELIGELTLNNIDKNLLKDIKISIGSETNSETDENEVKVEKKNLKDVFKRSVFKIKDDLKLKTREISNFELEEMFTGIDNSCDSIINCEQLGNDLTEQIERKEVIQEPKEVIQESKEVILETKDNIVELKDNTLETKEVITNKNNKKKKKKNKK